MKSKEWGSSRRVMGDDSGIITEVITHAHEPGVIYTRRTQPDADKILEENKQRRNAGGPRDMSFGRMVASIPLNDYMVLRKKYPEIASGDSETRQKALLKLAKSIEFKQYLVGKGT